IRNRAFRLAEGIEFLGHGRNQSMRMTLKDKVAVVTGAASGIGREIARTFARAGAKLAVFDLDAHGAEATARDLISDGASAIALAIDVCREDQVDSATARVVEAFGR